MYCDQKKNSRSSDYINKLLIGYGLILWVNMIIEIQVEANLSMKKELLVEGVYFVHSRCTELQ